MAKRFKLKDLLTHGLLKPDEEIYMDYRGLHFTGRVLADGSFRTDKGIFKSISYPTSLNIMEDEKYREWFYEYLGIPKDTPYHWTRIEEVKKLAAIKKPHIVGGWYLWKTWNGTSLDELRKKI
jgi:hypothetical protein